MELKAKLANPNFLNNAKEEVVTKEKEKFIEVRLAYLNGVQVVAGSNPVIPTSFFCSSQITQKKVSRRFRR